MKGLTVLERVILESMVNRENSFSDISIRSGLGETLCFNVLQALIIRGIVCSERNLYRINTNLSPKIMKEINGIEAKKSESLELIEAVLSQKNNEIYKFQKISLNSKDEKIFYAMLSNLESFLKEANLSKENSKNHMDKKVIFWGVGKMEKLVNQMIGGAA